MCVTLILEAICGVDTRLVSLATIHCIISKDFTVCEPCLRIQPLLIALPGYGDVREAIVNDFRGTGGGHNEEWLYPQPR